MNSLLYENNIWKSTIDIYVFQTVKNKTFFRKYKEYN